MNSIFKKTLGYLLITLIIFFTIISLLAIWDIINIQFIFRKIFLSILTIFITVLILYFIISTIFKNDK